MDGSRRRSERPACNFADGFAVRIRDRHAMAGGRTSFKLKPGADARRAFAQLSQNALSAREAAFARRRFPIEKASAASTGEVVSSMSWP